MTQGISVAQHPFLVLSANSPTRVDYQSGWHARSDHGDALDIAAWLHRLGLGQYEQVFRANDIEPDLLPTLTESDLRELGIASLGHRKRLLTGIAALAGSTAPPAPPPPPASPPSSTPLQAERRQLTVMFVDLVGSTALASHLDPEDMREVLHGYQNSVTGQLARLGGHVAKLMGDGVLAYFGWPRADEDDAERAVQAGLALLDTVGRLSTPAGEPLVARVGIATGLVVVGDLIGEGAAREEAVVGETPNLAARLQAAASPGAVVIADSTRRLLGTAFDLHELAPLQLKGFARPVKAFEVLGEHRTGSRFESRCWGRPLPMVGRDQELALVLERWRQAQSGEGQAVLLVGEAGIGKSRLVQATLEAVADGRHLALRYQCSPHHIGTALWPVIQQLTIATDLAPQDSEAAKLDKLEQVLSLCAEDILQAAPLVASLLGIEATTRYPAENLTPQQRRSRTLAVLVEQLLGLARREPVLMVVEDTHWADPTTLELVGQALDRIAGTRVLMLLTSRPDNQPALSGHPHVTRLTLNRLGRGPTQSIIAHLSGATSLPPDVLGEIAARTDGVPLFVEELTKAVLEGGTAGPTGVVPVSLHASLMARLDRVPGVKEVAQVAACIGREFSYSLLAAVSSTQEAELRGALDRLVAAELIFARGAPPEARYAFKHALVREAAHESLLRSQRQHLHARIARALEELVPQAVDREPELLAQHYTEAGLAEQAVAYWQRAGQQALARSAMAEAVTQLTRGLGVLGQLPGGSERQRRELGLQLALGQASIAAKGFAAPETGRAYARARELCLELGSVTDLFPVLYGRSVFHFQRGELAAAHEVAQELLRLSQDTGDATAQVTGYRMIGSVLSQQGRFGESRDAFEAALARYDPVRDRTSAHLYAIDSRVMSLSWLSHLDLILGNPERALARHVQVPTHVREIAHLNTTAVALAWGCIFRQLRGDRESAQEQAEAVMALASEQKFPLYRATGTVVRGWALAEGGQQEEGIAAIRQGLADYAATGAEMWAPYFLGLLAEAHDRARDAAAGLSVIEEALHRIGRTGARWTEAELFRVWGELLLDDGGHHQPQAETCFRRALAIAHDQSAILWELRAATSLARLWRQQARLQEARDLLVPLCNRFPDEVNLPDLQEARMLIRCALLATG